MNFISTNHLPNANMGGSNNTEGLRTSYMYGPKRQTSFRIQDTGDSDSEAEQERLAEYEAALKENAPDYVLDPDEQLAVSQDSPEWYQLHLATERIRIPEILFQVRPF